MGINGSRPPGFSGLGNTRGVRDKDAAANPFPEWFQKESIVLASPIVVAPKGHLAVSARDSQGNALVIDAHPSGGPSEARFVRAGAGETGAGEALTPQLALGLMVELPKAVHRSQRGPAPYNDPRFSNLMKALATIARDSNGVASR